MLTQEASSKSSQEPRGRQQYPKVSKQGKNTFFHLAFLIFSIVGCALAAKAHQYRPLNLFRHQCKDDLAPKVG